MTKIIWENFSENERGRPRKEIWYKKQYRDKLQELSESPRQSSFRTLQNTYYRLMAMEALCLDGYKPDPNYQWLLGAGENFIGQKRTILTELGRIYAIDDDAEGLRYMAKWLCEKKPRTTDMIRLLRAVRRETPEATMIA